MLTSFRSLAHRRTSLDALPLPPSPTFLSLSLNPLTHHLSLIIPCTSLTHSLTDDPVWTPSPSNVHPPLHDAHLTSLALYSLTGEPVWTPPAAAPPSDKLLEPRHILLSKSMQPCPPLDAPLPRSAPLPLFIALVNYSPVVIPLHYPPCITPQTRHSEGQRLSALLI